MKEIIYNENNLDSKDINREVRRAKCLLVNKRGEILLGYGYNNYQLIGGHVEGGENDEACLEREIEEETGIKLSIGAIEPILGIRYMLKDYPNLGDNSLYINNYYYLYTDEVPDKSKLHLTDLEKEGMFEFRYISKDKVLEELNDSLKTCSKENVVLDTLKAVEEFLLIESR